MLLTSSLLYPLAGPLISHKGVLFSQSGLVCNAQQPQKEEGTYTILLLLPT